MDLDTWRRQQKLTYEQLGELIGVTSPSQVRRYCIGAERPGDERMAVILEKTGNAVDLYAMHNVRIEWLRRQPSRVVAEVAPAGSVEA